MLHRVAALLGVALVIAGCATPPSGFVNGTSVHHIKVGGRDRSYRLYMPAGLPASVPLLVMMHGVSGSARQAERDLEHKTTNGTKWPTRASSSSPTQMASTEAGTLMGNLLRPVRTRRRR